MSLQETDILLVEDSAEDVELVSHVLRRGGCGFRRRKSLIPS